ncbi:MAG TPA: hypothetical protein PK659_02235, partial [Methanothrix sp.]
LQEARIFRREMGHTDGKRELRCSALRPDIASWSRSLISLHGGSITGINYPGLKTGVPPPPPKVVRPHLLL